MGATVNTRIQLKRDTTENWNNARGFIPMAGEVIVYTDYETKTYQTEEYGEMVTKTVQIPNIKIGTGINGSHTRLRYTRNFTRKSFLE